MTADNARDGGTGYKPGDTLIVTEPTTLIVVAVYEDGTHVLRTPAGATVIAPPHVMAQWERLDEHS